MFNKMNVALMAIGCLILTGSCINREKNMDDYTKGSYGYDLNYLSKKDSLIILSSADGQSQVVVSAKYQGKVFTSTAEGLDGQSMGWVNYSALDADHFDEHMNGYGGENRLWLGPEGGSYSIFFEPGVDQVFDNWHTPKGIDIESWNIESSNDKEAILSKKMDITNYLGTNMKVEIRRKVTLLNREAILKSLPKVEISNSIRSVAYHTENSILNRDDFEWTPESGMVCLWMLDMYPTSDESYTLIPYEQGSEDELGVIVNSDYFGAISEDRLKDEDGVLVFKADGKSRGKLGLSSKRAKPIAGNYDAIANRLTITIFDLDKNGTYLNQMWDATQDPLIGDALHAYNDGPLEDGAQMGPFLEIESSSPAAQLKPGEKLTHNHAVYHFVGDKSELSKISEQLLGISLYNKSLSCD